MTKDPDGGDKDRPLSQNPYAYAEGNPVMNVDPEGEIIMAIIAIIVIIALLQDVIIIGAMGVRGLANRRRKKNKQPKKCHNVISKPVINTPQPKAILSKPSNGPDPLVSGLKAFYGLSNKNASPPSDPTFRQEQQGFQPRQLPRTGR